MWSRRDACQCRHCVLHRLFIVRKIAHRHSGESGNPSRNFLDSRESGSDKFGHGIPIAESPKFEKALCVPLRERADGVCSGPPTANYPPRTTKVTSKAIWAAPIPSIAKNTRSIRLFTWSIRRLTSCSPARKSCRKSWMDTDSSSIRPSSLPNRVSLLAVVIEITCNV